MPPTYPRGSDSPGKACLVNWISILNCCFLAFLEIRNSNQIGFQCYHGNTRSVKDFDLRLSIQTKVYKTFTTNQKCILTIDYIFYHLG